MSSTSGPTSERRELPVRIITPHNGLDAFTDAIKSLKRDFPQSRVLAWRMLLRDTRATYRQSLLGYVWLFLPPLATALGATVSVMPWQHHRTDPSAGS